jgi:hypothetical protein
VCLCLIPVLCCAVVWCAAANKYGTVVHLQEKDYVQEVSKAPEDTFVVLLLYVHR